MKAIRYIEKGRPKSSSQSRNQEKGKFWSRSLVWRLALNGICMSWMAFLLPGGKVGISLHSRSAGTEAAGKVSVGAGVAEFAAGDRAAFWQDRAGAKQGCYAEYVTAEVGNLLKVPSFLEPQEIASWNWPCACRFLSIKFRMSLASKASDSRLAGWDLRAWWPFNSPKPMERAK